jgi:hypothetical protein
MPGAATTDSLLRSCAWEAEKLLRKRGNFSSVLFVVEYADGSRQRLERYCNNAPASASDGDLLAELAKDAARDFAETNVVRFGVAYLCKRTITLRPIDPASTMKPSTTKRRGVCIEVHGDNEPVGLFREVLHSSGGRAMLGAAEPLEGVTGSPYAGVLQLAAEWKADAEAAAKAVDAKAKTKVAAREASSWPPRFLVSNSPRRPIQPA